MTPTYHIRPMTQPEVHRLAVEWAAAEGWNPGLHDADAFFATDPAGFLVGELGDEPIGCISAVSYGGAFGFIGFYIVQPAFRGQGYGILLWQKALEKLAGQPVGLDGVFAQQANYARAGFVFAYSNLRFEFSGEKPTVLPAENVVPLASVPLPDLLAYDLGCFPTERPAFLQAWLRLPESHGWAVVENGRLRGYGVIRRCRVGYKIGPLFADDLAVARTLWRRLVAGTAPGERVYLDVPEINAPGLRLTEELGMKKVFGTARMYLGPAPAFDVDRVFGVTSFELG